MKPTWQTIGQQILRATRNELYLNLPFLDAALCALPFDTSYDTPTLATDAKVLYYNGAWLASRYERGRSLVCRAYLHTILHCMLRHPAKKKGRDGELWDLCCDIAVESRRFIATFGEIPCQNMTVQLGAESFCRMTIAFGKKHSRNRSQKTHGRALPSRCRQGCRR